jgi:uncharacterized OsmC-like protein
VPEIKHELNRRGFRPEEYNGMKKPELLKLLEKNWETPLVWPLGKPLIVASKVSAVGKQMAANMSIHAPGGDFSVLTDEPEKIGGENAGPNPMELLLCSLVGCNQATANIVNERKFKLPIESINYKAEGVYDARGFFGVEGVSPAYQSIDLVANVTPKAGETITQSELDALAGVVASRCPVEALFNAANIPVKAVWQLQDVSEDEIGSPA